MRSVNWRDGLQNRVPRFNSGRGLQKIPDKSAQRFAIGATCAPMMPQAPVQKPVQLQDTFVACSP